MCGICGIVDWSGVGRDSIEKMTDALRHRGPDDCGYFTDDHVLLGHRRLSIIDLSSAGHQPMSNEAGDLQLVFNGEIYDYENLRKDLIKEGHDFKSHSDSEVLLHLYEDFGEDLVEKVNGMFGFAIWDANRRRLVIGRDRTGKKPLYYSLAKNRISFASELKALARGGISEEALHAYLVLGYVPGELSIYGNIHKLLPGSVAVFDEGGFRSRRYFVPEVEDGRWNRDHEEYETEFAGLLRGAVERRLVADVEVGLFLSGGVDSSLIAALATERHRRIKTFSIGFTAGAFDETKHAARVAETLGTEHHVKVVDPNVLMETVSDVARIFDEPFSDASAIPTTLLARMTREHVKVALGGDGGDELFGGYPTLRAQAWADRISWARPLAKTVQKAVNGLDEGSGYYPVGYVAKRFASSFDLEPWRRQLHWTSYVSPDQVGTILPGANGFPRAVEEIAASCSGKSSHETSRMLDQRLYLPDNILVKTDRATMSCALEARAPFLDRHLVDFANHLPNELASGKVLLRRLLRKTKVPFAAHRPKKGFAVPVSAWLRGDLKGWARERLEHASKLGLDARGIDVIWNEHQTKARDRWREIWAIVMLAEWDRQWRI